MNTLDFVLGVMRQNTNALGFIPRATIEQRYIAHQQIVLATKAGTPVGYLLHGVARPGGVLTIAQHVVEYDYREHGYGMDAVRELIARAQTANCRAVVLRCAEDLHANQFWAAAGFERTARLTASNARQRAINVYTFDLWPKLWDIGVPYAIVGSDKRAVKQEAAA